MLLERERRRETEGEGEGEGVMDVSCSYLRAACGWEAGHGAVHSHPDGGRGGAGESPAAGCDGPVRVHTGHVDALS